MSEMKLFENAIALPAELLEELQATSNNLMSGGSGGMPRISIKGSRFRQIVGGEQVAVNEGNSMNIVIIEAAPLAGPVTPTPLMMMYLPQTVRVTAVLTVR